MASVAVVLSEYFLSSLHIAIREWVSRCGCSSAQQNQRRYQFHNALLSITKNMVGAVCQPGQMAGCFIMFEDAGSVGGRCAPWLAGANRKTWNTADRA